MSPVALLSLSSCLCSSRNSSSSSSSKRQAADYWGHGGETLGDCRLHEAWRQGP